MSTNNLFDYSRKLPVPFDTLPTKSIKVVSKYNSTKGANTNLCASITKAVLALCRCRLGGGPGAIGAIDRRAVVEYKSAEPDIYHIVVYDPQTGLALASVYNVKSRTCETYTAHKSKRDGSAILMAMLPTLMEDTEFSEHLEKFYDAFGNGYPDLNQAAIDLAILSDNAYRRIKDSQCAAPVKTNIDAAGNLTRISSSHLDSGCFDPTIVMAGEFEIFAQTHATTIIKPSWVLNQEDFTGKYGFNTARQLSAYEQSLVPVLEPWHILSPEIVSCCKHAKASTGKNAPMRNFMLRGPAGTGKTAGARAFAAGVGLPYMKYTCSANTEIFDCATCS